MKLTGKSDNSPQASPAAFGMGLPSATATAKPTLPSLAPDSTAFSSLEKNPAKANPGHTTPVAKPYSNPPTITPPAHPINRLKTNDAATLNFSAHSLSTQTRQFVSSIFTLTRASEPIAKNPLFSGNTLNASIAPENQKSPDRKSSSIGFRFSPNRWSAGDHVMVFNLHPEILDSDTLGPKAAQAPQFSAAAATRELPEKKTPPDAGPRLSSFEKAILKQPSVAQPFSAKNKFATTPLASQSTRAATGGSSLTFAQRLHEAVAQSDYRQNPFDILSDNISSSDDAAIRPHRRVQTATGSKPDYKIQAYDRIIRPASELPLAIQALAETDERLRQPNAIARYAYLPNSQTVLKQPAGNLQELENAGIKAQPLWYTAAVQFAAQALKPMVEAAPWLKSLDPLGMSVDDQTLWLGSRWDVPLMEYRTADGQPARIYNVTRLSDGQLAMVVRDSLVDEVPLTQKPTTFAVGDNPLALVSAPQPERQPIPLTPNLTPKSVAKATSAIAANSPQASPVLNESAANASSTGPLSAQINSSRAQPKFGSRAYYRQWIEEQVARFESQKGVSLIT